MLRLVNNNERKFNKRLVRSRSVCALRLASRGRTAYRNFHDSACASAWRSSGQFLIADFISEMEVGHTKKKLKDGRVWVKCTQKTMTDNIPFLTEETVRNSVRKLEAKGILSVDILDDDKFDRTYWYSLTDYGSRLIDGKGSDSHEGTS